MKTKGTLIILFLVFVAQPYLAPVRAVEITPKKDYPHTTRGTCQKFHDYGGTLVKDHLKEAIALCEQEGVHLTNKTQKHGK